MRPASPLGGGGVSSGGTGGKSPSVDKVRILSELAQNRRKKRRPAGRKCGRQQYYQSINFCLPQQPAKRIAINPQPLAYQRFIESYPKANSFPLGNRTQDGKMMVCRIPTRRVICSMQLLKFCCEASSWVARSCCSGSASICLPVIPCIDSTAACSVYHSTR